MSEESVGNTQLDETAKRKTAFLQVFGKKAGIITATCKAVGISRNTFYEWLKADKSFAIDVTELNEQQIDFTESKLMSKIRSGNMTAIIFFLKCKGKARGWVERQELTGAAGADLIPPDVEARRETERISELMRDPDYRRIHCELLAAADRISGKNGGNGAHGGNGSGGNGSGEPCRLGEAGD